MNGFPVVSFVVSVLVFWAIPWTVAANDALEALDFYAKLPRKHLSRDSPPDRSNDLSRPLAFEDIILAAAHRYAVNPGLIRAVIKVESDFDHRAVSSAGAMGLMQLMPSTARAYGVRRPLDPWENIHAGTAHLSILMNEFGGDLKLVLAAYNAGPEYIRQGWKLPEETKRYVRRVLAYFQRRS